ncbi:hypothetical protein E2C01_077997 [Portunus trituberculatus]|uniref:Uncharacterized protein n=1 Tax=Portunus trituberculatus TaxID=210409 RepID=A0A5B7IFV0_PORTR|nr:hypothetical protein [Portunus trituberculatus]
MAAGRAGQPPPPTLRHCNGPPVPTVQLTHRSLNVVGRIGFPGGSRD